MCSTSADGDLDGLSDGELLEHVGSLVAEQNRLSARLARAVRRAENRQASEHDGLRTMSAWLRTHTRLSGPAILGLVRQGRAMEHLPAVEAAYLAGGITGDSVETIAEIVRPEHLDRALAQDVDLGEVALALVDIAGTHPHRELQKAVGRYLAQLDPDGREPDPTEERALTVAQHPDGSVTLGGPLDQVGGETVLTALGAHAAASRCTGDTRTRAQRLADALVQLCANALATGSVPQLCDSLVSRIVFGPGSAPTDLGRTQRVVSPLNAAPSRPATAAASSPDARHPIGGATPTGPRMGVRRADRSWGAATAPNEGRSLAGAQPQPAAGAGP